MSIRKEFRVEVAKKTRRCINCDNEIEKNFSCIAFRYGSSYYSISANLCRVCILDMQEEMYHIDLDSARKKSSKKGR